MNRCLLFTLAAIILIFTYVQPVKAQEEPLSVYYAGLEGSVKSALELAEFNFVSDPSLADVIVLNGIIPNLEIRKDQGLVLILGDYTGQAQVTDLLGIPLTLISRDDPASLTALTGLNDPLVNEILWNGAPQVRERAIVNTSISSVQPVVVDYESGDWILWQGSSGREYIFSAFLNDTNPQIQEWPYFNYLIYHLVERSAGRIPLSFANYQGSPVPHPGDRTILMIILGILFLTSFGVFLYVRGYSRKHPEALDQIIADRAHYEAREARTEWEQVGFHRPLSGLLVGITTGAILFIPLIIYQNLVLPQFILPSAQAFGIWGRVTQFFAVAWTLFDAGTAMAGMKFLSQYRVNDPKRGIQYMQLFVWWQVLSGAVQVALVVILASTIGVQSSYSIFAWSIIIHTFIQIPGFYTVMRNTLNALQRTDYARYLDNIVTLLMPMLVQPVVVTVFYFLGKQNPTFGAALGGVIGLGVAAYLIELFSFLVGLWMYRRLGYQAKIVFLAHFDWRIIKEAMSFGIFEMLGGLIVSAGAAMEIWMTQTRLINYTEIWGNWGLAQNFIFAFTVTTNLYDGVMPAISEAISSGRKMLCQYYAVQSYKWGAIASAFLAAILLVIAPRFIIGSSGKEFERAAQYVVPLILFGALQYLSWTGDSILLGSNHPRLRAALILLEQSVRVVFSLLLLERFQINALIMAYLAGVILKGIIVYFVIDRVAFPQRFYFWQSVAAPLLAAAAHYLWLNWVARLIWTGDEITSILLFLIGLFFSLPIFMFLYSLAGGWDDGTLAELKEAGELTGFLRGIVRFLFTIPIEIGARISPLNNRFPITMRASALLEAKSLTAEKVKL